LVLVFSTVSYLTLYSRTIDGLDRELSVRAEELFARCSVREGTVSFDASTRETSFLQGLAQVRSMEVQAWPGGTLLFLQGPSRSEGLSPPPGPVDATYTLRHTTQDEEEDTTVDIDDRVCELVAAPPGAEPGSGILVRVLVAADYEPVEEQLEGYLGYLVVLDVVFVLAAILIGRALASRLVNPITRLRTAALEASAGSNAPMPRTGRGDELDDLASVLDTSFAELQLALARQKRFTADAAHELRNPLSAILSSAEVALRQERSPERNAALFGDILVETRRIDEILQALLLLARADAGSMEVRFSRVALGDLLLDLARDMQGPGPGVAVEGEALVEGDPTLLRVLFRNLFANALRFSPPDQPVRVTLASKDSWVAVEVFDQGPGIASPHRDHIFERFYRAHDGTGPTGTAGLGLSIAQAIVEAHGGTIELVDGKVGTRLRVRLPGPPETGRTAQAQG